MDGQGAEKMIARVLRGTGAICTVNASQTGAADIEAVWEGVTTWLVQVKFSEAGPPKWPARQELGRLRRRASLRKDRATAVVALVWTQRPGARASYVLKSARTERKVKPPDTREKTTPRHRRGGKTR